MVAFGILPKNIWRWQGRTKITLSFYECRVNGGDTQTAPAVIKLVLVFLNAKTSTSTNSQSFLMFLVSQLIFQTSNTCK